MTTLCIRAMFFTFVVHGSGVDIVEARVVRSPLSGWRCLTRLDHWIGRNSEQDSDFYRSVRFPPKVLFVH